MWKLLGAFSLICPSCARSLTNAAAATAAFVVGGRVSSRRSVILTRLPTVKLNQLSFSLLQYRIRIHSAYRLLCVYVLTWLFFGSGVFLRFGVFLLLFSFIVVCMCKFLWWIGNFPLYSHFVYSLLANCFTFFVLRNVSL